MKALSIRQPWAWLIANNFKPLENRSWNTHYRGDFLIHTGKKIDKDAYLFLYHEFPQIHALTPQPADIETGGIIGKAQLVNVVHETDKRHLTKQDKPWFFGEYGFMIDNAKTCNLIPCHGQLSFFTPDIDLQGLAI